MLRYAIGYQEQIRQYLRELAFDPKYRYYQIYGYFEDYVPAENGWKKSEQVSVTEDAELLGYFDVHFDRDLRSAYSLGVIKFSDKEPATFLKDMISFIDQIFTVHHMNKLRLEVAVGSPNEKHYDRLVVAIGGRIVGTFCEDGRLLDGTVVDLKQYEIMARNYKRRTPMGGN